MFGWVVNDVSETGVLALVAPQRGCNIEIVDIDSLLRGRTMWDRNLGARPWVNQPREIV